LRGLAVLIVLIGHAGGPYLRSGGVGVDIFFTLSGFLITSLLLREWADHGSISIRNFYVRRFLRLIPCLWLTVGLFLLTSWALRGTSESLPLNESAFALSYTMNWIRAFDLGGHGDLGHTWSLAIEEQYYIIWPVAVMVMCWILRDRHRTMGVVLLLAAVGVAAYRAMMIGSYSAERIYFGMDTHADGVLAGAALACFLVPRGQAGAADGATASSGRGGLILAYVATPAAILTLLLVMTTWTWRDDAMARFGYALCAIASIIIIRDLVVPGPSVIRKAMGNSALVWIGKVSYGLYLLHYPIYGLLGEFDFMWDWKRKFLIGGALAALAAAASYYLVEKRFLKLKDRFTRHELVPAPIATVGSVEAPPVLRAA